MRRWILPAAVIVEFVAAWPCAGQPVGGGTGASRGLMGVEMLAVDGRMIDAERRASLVAKLPDVEKARLAKRAEGLRTGMMIVGLRKDGPADKAGIRREDIITAVNGQPVESFQDLQRGLRGVLPGQTVELRYRRIEADGKVVDQIAKLELMSGEAVFKLTNVPPGEGGFGFSRNRPARLDENFDGLTPGGLPKEWRAERTGAGETAGWEIFATPAGERNVLQVVRPTNAATTLNLCIFENAVVGGNMFMRVRLKAVGGTKSQAGGIVWNCQDEGNFYMALLDFQHGVVEVYKVIDGAMTLLKSEKRELKPNEWYEIRPEQANGRVQVWMGKPSRLVLRSDRDLTLQSGQVGVVTKGDTEMMFDEISAQRTPSPGGI